MRTLSEGLSGALLLWPLLLQAQISAQISADDYSGCAGTTASQTISATPDNYRNRLNDLQPGDVLQLASGDYTRHLPLNNLNGTAGNCITIEGPDDGSARFLASSSSNTIDLVNASYLIIRNLELAGQNFSVDAIKAKSESVSAHHITLENLYIHDYDSSQQNVGISTKCPAWNWVIRNNHLENIGTGIYLGNSNGQEEFVQGLIEYNLITTTIGYNMQIKHQNSRSNAPGLPAGDSQTIIRHNVFSKSTNSSTGGLARPNLLVGHFPDSGPGANDEYLIYGNFFYQNPTESLFQGEGNVAFYNNVLYKNSGSAVRIQPHNDVPKMIRVFYNTILTGGVGIHISGGDPAFTQKAIGNAVFSNNNPPIEASDQQDNITDTLAAAGNYLQNPGGMVGSALNLFPLAGQLTGTTITTTDIDDFVDWNRDFNGVDRDADNHSFRGAYSGEGQNPGWLLALDFKGEESVGPAAEIFSNGFE